MKKIPIQKDYHHNSRMIRIDNEDVDILEELHRLDPHSMSRQRKLHSIIQFAKNEGYSHRVATGVVSITG